MMFINNRCTDFMFQEAMMCETCSPSILSLIIFNFLLVFKISQDRQTDRQIYLFDQIEKYNDRYIIESRSGVLH